MPGFPPIPALAPGFIPRPESGEAASSALIPGATVVLVSDRGAGPGTGDPAPREAMDSSGKTQLAIRLATSLREAGTVEVVIWVAATSRASVLSGYGEAAAALGLLSPAGDSRADADVLAARLIGWLQETARPWLVVLDDLTDDTTLDRLWPAGPAGRVLVTTTSTAVLSPLRRGEHVIVPIGVFSHREAVSYMMGRLTEDLDQRQGAADLVAELADVPLALRQASSAIATSELTCRSYLQEFTARRDDARAGGPQHPGAAAAALTWTLSVEQAVQLAGAIAHAQLTFAALLDGNGIPLPIFIEAGRRPAVSAQTIVEGLEALEASGLVSTDQTTSPALVRVSWAVQAAARAATPEAGIGPVASAAAGGMLASWPADDQPEWLARAYRSCADRLRRIAGDALWQGGCPPLLMRAGQSLDAMRASREVVEYWRELASVSDRLLGRDHPDTLAICERLARAYVAAGQPAEAISWFEWVEKDLTSRLGTDSLATADASRELGSALLAAGRAANAVPVLTDAVAAYDTAAGVDSMQAMGTRDDLITALRMDGQLFESVWLGKRALADRERVQGEQHPDTLATAVRLAEAHLAEGQPKLAISLLRRVTGDRETVLGPLHPDTIAARSALADAYQAAGKMASAAALHEQVRADYTHVLGGEHRLTLAVSLSLAQALRGAGRPADASKVLLETAERCELHLPADDPLVASVAEAMRDPSGDGPEAGPVAESGQGAQRPGFGRRLADRYRATR